MLTRDISLLRRSLLDRARIEKFRRIRICAPIWTCINMSFTLSLFSILFERLRCCCCMASKVSANTFNVSQEWIACLAASCNITKSQLWCVGRDRLYGYRYQSRTYRILYAITGLTFSMLRTTSRINQIDESCMARIDSISGICNENGSEDGIFDHICDSVAWRRAGNACGIPTHNIEHWPGLQLEKKVISCHV